MTKHILIVAPAWVGDMVMSQSLFKILKANGSCKIDLVAPKATLAIAERMREIHKAYLLDVGHGGVQWHLRCLLARKLRRQRYDQVIVLPNSWKSALMPFLAKIKVRTGWRGEWRYGLLNDMRHLDKTQLPLMIQRFCALGLEPNAVLAHDLPWPQLCVNPVHAATLREKFALTDSDKPILALCPGAEFGPSKRWPAEYFGQLAKQKLAEGWQVWLFGSPKDTADGETIQTIANTGCHNLIGQTTLAQAIDLLSLVKCVISNDSGLMHIAAALDKPLIVIYGSTDPGFTPPLSNKATILSLHLSCSPCFKRDCPLNHGNCLQQLTPDMVLKAMT